MTASLSLPSADALVLALAAAAAAAAVVLLVVVMFIRSQRRHAAQLTQVIARLERLEEAGILTETAPASREGAPAADTGGFDSDTPTGDVLAGMTSHVRRMVENGDADPVTLADEAIVCVYRHLDEALAPNALASELCVSLRSLERGLAAGLDCTPRELIRTVKMREARRLLASGGHNVAEVAARTGFSSPFHFSRSFKDFFGIAPSLVRPDVQQAPRAQRQ